MLCECLIYMHVNNWVLFPYFVLILTPKKMKFIFSISSSDLSFKTKRCSCTVEMIEQNCSIPHYRILEYSFITRRIELQSVLSLILISQTALVDSESTTNRVHSLAKWHKVW